MTRLQCERGSSLPLLVFIAAFALVAGMLLVNVQQAAIGDMRVADYARSLALVVARSGIDATSAAEQVIKSNQGVELEVSVEAVDAKTFAATVCLTQPLVFELFELTEQRVCQRSLARWLSG
jgi:5-enolpyruvylshikimate-3-phosphate synthase